jgi:hypothetical protein
MNPENRVFPAKKKVVGRNPDTPFYVPDNIKGEMGSVSMSVLDVQNADPEELAQLKKDGVRIEFDGGF